MAHDINILSSSLFSAVSSGPPALAGISATLQRSAAAADGARGFAEATGGTSMRGQRCLVYPELVAPWTIDRGKARKDGDDGKE